MDDVILIASWLEPELVASIRGAAPWAEVAYEPDLLRPPRYPADHTGRDVARTPEEEERWKALLGRATILFDFDQTHREDLPDLAPRVRWVQGTSAGIGQFVHRMRYAERMPDTVFTTASGVHARPLAEFAAMCMVGHVRGLLPLVEAQRRRHWERFAGSDLEGRTVVVVGYGSIGQEVGRVSRALGLRVIGVRRTTANVDPGELHADEIHPRRDLSAHLPRADFLVLCAPHTPDTEGLIGAAELDTLPEGAALINVGRGALVVEAALIEGLERGRPAAAFLDVFETEPLPDDSPLWGLPNVLVSPHSASTSDRENRRIVSLFCENLARWRAQHPLLNQLDPELMY